VTPPGTAGPAVLTAWSGAGVSAGANRARSGRFVLESTTGQPTPVAEGVSSGASFHHLPGVEGVRP
jgi:hypothetical protein